jgi:hypothetical protein
MHAEPAARVQLIDLYRRASGWLAQLEFRKAIWFAPLAWTLHEAEEWNIHEFEREHFVDPGYFALVDHPILWLGLAQVALQGILWTTLTAWPRTPRAAAFLTLPYFIVLPFGNALMHVYWQLRFGGYTPGVLTAVFLVAPVVLGLTIKAVRSRLIPAWYACLFLAASLALPVSAIQSGENLPMWLQSAQQNGIEVARALLGRDDDG